MPDPTAASRHALFGQPVAQSLSPRIHAAFAEQIGIVLRYDAIESSAAQLPERLSRFAADGGRGANITLPLKQAVLALCTQLSARARLAGAVNTLIRVAHAWHGDNTDGVGLVRDLTQRHGIVLEGQRVLVLGAGGAARGVVPALLDAGITQLTVANRSLPRAQALQACWGHEPRLRITPWDTLHALQAPDILVDATAAGRDSAAMPPLSPRLIGHGTVAVSLNYGRASEGFLHWAEAHGCAACIDGLGMLVEQAAESFHLWHGVLPQTDPVLQALRSG